MEQDIHTIEDKLKWLGHVQRIISNLLLKAVSDWSPNDKKERVHKNLIRIIQLMTPPPQNYNPSHYIVLNRKIKNNLLNYFLGRGNPHLEAPKEELDSVFQYLVLKLSQHFKCML